MEDVKFLRNLFFYSHFLGCQICFFICFGLYLGIFPLIENENLMSNLDFCPFYVFYLSFPFFICASYLFFWTFIGFKMKKIFFFNFRRNGTSSDFFGVFIFISWSHVFIFIVWVITKVGFRVF